MRLASAVWPTPWVSLVPEQAQTASGSDTQSPSRLQHSAHRMDSSPLSPAGMAGPTPAPSARADAQLEALLLSCRPGPAAGPTERPLQPYFGPAEPVARPRCLGLLRPRCLAPWPAADWPRPRPAGRQRRHGP